MLGYQLGCFARLLTVCHVWHSCLYYMKKYVRRTKSTYHCTSFCGAVGGHSLDSGVPSEVSLVRMSDEQLPTRTQIEEAHVCFQYWYLPLRRSRQSMERCNPNYCPRNIVKHRLNACCITSEGSHICKDWDVWNSIEVFVGNGCLRVCCWFKLSPDVIKSRMQNMQPGEYEALSTQNK